MKQPNFAAMSPVVAKAIEQMMAEQGDKFSLEKVNLAELKRRTGISRARLRRMKEHGFEDTEHAAKGRKASTTRLYRYPGWSAEERRDKLRCVPQQAPCKRIYWQPDHD